MFKRWIFRWANVFIQRQHGTPEPVDGVYICRLSAEGKDWFYENFSKRIK